MINTDEIATLKDLGLSLVNAKVYWTLLHWNEIDAAILAKESKVARGDTYRVLNELEEMGLVERIIASPAKFRATPIEKCVEVLFQKKLNEVRKLKKRSKTLLRNYRKKPVMSNKGEFMKFSGRRVQTRVRESINSAQENIDLHLTAERFSYGVFLFRKSIEDSISRGVTWRILINKPKQGSVCWNQLHYFKKRPRCNVKFIANSPKMIFSLFDQKEIYIFEDPAELLKNTSALWSNTPSLLAMAETNFEMIWKFMASDAIITNE